MAAVLSPPLPSLPDNILGFLAQRERLRLDFSMEYLQYLCLKKVLEAATAFRAYTKHHPNIKMDPPFSHPLLNFLWLLIISIKVTLVAIRLVG